MIVNCINNKQQEEKLREIATRNGFPLVAKARTDDGDYSLFFDREVLTLRDNTVHPAVEVAIDFCNGSNVHRQRFGGGFGQPVARAVNAKKLQSTESAVCDATGGFGRDAFVFASLGCRVVMLERSRVVFELLRDAIDRAMADETMADIANRMHVHFADSADLPGAWPEIDRPHTIYLDPMYPKSGKSAAAKKEMQTLKRLLDADQKQADTDNRRLLDAALRTALNRVVVKRPATAAPIPGPSPVGEIKSANTRYDIYHPIAG